MLFLTKATLLVCERGNILFAEAYLRHSQISVVGRFSILGGGFLFLIIFAKGNRIDILFHFKSQVFFSYFPLQSLKIYGKFYKSIYQQDKITFKGQYFVKAEACWKYSLRTKTKCLFKKTKSQNWVFWNRAKDDISKDGHSFSKTIFPWELTGQCVYITQTLEIQINKYNNTLFINTLGSI